MLRGTNNNKREEKNMKIKYCCSYFFDHKVNPHAGAMSGLSKLFIKVPDFATHFFIRYLGSVFLCVFMSVNTHELESIKPKFIGNISGQNQIAENYLQYWHQITPENAGRWSAIEATRDRMHWAPLEKIYTYAKENNLLFTEYALVSSGAYPVWFASISKAEFVAEYDEFVAEFCAHFPETDYTIVVNEPFDVPYFFRESLDRSDGADKWDWVVHAFERARVHCPDTKLVINEYRVFSSESRLQEYKQLVEKLKDKQLLDVIGIQSHTFDLELSTAQTIENALDELHSTGLPIYITEFDIAGRDQQQMEIYEEIFPLLYSHPSVEGITLWGYQEGKTWMSDVHLLDRDGYERPAFAVVKRYLNESCPPYCTLSSSASSAASSIDSSSSSMSSSSMESSSLSTYSQSSYSSSSAGQMYCDWYGQVLPICVSANNAYGWGWENNRNCVGAKICPVVVSTSASNSSASTCNWYGTDFPFCEITASGFGWEMGHTCVARETCASQ